MRFGQVQLSYLSGEREQCLYAFANDPYRKVF